MQKYKNKQNLYYKLLSLQPILISKQSIAACFVLPFVIKCLIFLNFISFINTYLSLSYVGRPRERWLNQMIKNLKAREARLKIVLNEGNWEGGGGY